MNIRVVKIIMGFKDKPYISKYLTPTEINKMHKEILNLDLKICDYSYRNGDRNISCNINLGYQEGYFIQNIDDESLDLSCVETDNNIKELKKYEITCLQLKSLIFLLFRNKQSLTIDNGKFYISNRELFKNNNLPLDIYLSNFYFEFDSVYKLDNKFHIWSGQLNNIRFKAYTYIPIFNNYLFLQIDNNTFNKNIKNYDYYWPKWGKTLLNDSKSLSFFNYIFNKAYKIKTLQKVIKHLVLPLNSTDPSLQHKFIYWLLPKRGDLDFSGYYNIASETNHILGTYMKGGTNIYTTSKASSKYRNTDIETYYNGQTIKNPIEFNMPNAKGKISLLLGKKFKEKLIDNMDFGDLTFDKLEIADFNDKIAKKLQKDNSELICNRISKANCDIKEVIINCKELYKVEGNIDKIKTQKINNADFININNLYLLDGAKGLFLASDTSTVINNLYITKNKCFLKLDSIRGKIDVHIKNLITTDNSTECSILINCWGNSHPHFKIVIDKIDSNIKILKAYFSIYGTHPILGLENPAKFCLKNKISKLSSASVHIVKDKTNKYGWHECLYEWNTNL